MDRSLAAWPRALLLLSQYHPIHHELYSYMYKIPSSSGELREFFHRSDGIALHLSFCKFAAAHQRDYVY